MTCVLGDPSREPRLERAMPADAVPGSTIPEDSEAEILLRDGTWVWAQVIGQRKDRHGRWCVGIRWYASPTVGGREGWYLSAPGLFRGPPLAPAAASAARPAAAPGQHPGRAAPPSFTPRRRSRPRRTGRSPAQRPRTPASRTLPPRPQRRRTQVSRPPAPRTRGSRTRPPRIQPPRDQPPRIRGR